MSSAAAEKVVCVTGAYGYKASASWLVKTLVSRVYTVKASVRDPNDTEKTEHLLALDGAPERLQLFKANFLEEGSYGSVVEGCDAVFHTASPFYHDVKDPQADIALAMDIKGTEVAKESSDDIFAPVMKVVRWIVSACMDIEKFIPFEPIIAFLLTNFVAAVSSDAVPPNGQVDFNGTRPVQSDPTLVSTIRIPLHVKLELCFSIKI